MQTVSAFSMSPDRVTPTACVSDEAPAPLGEIESHPTGIGAVVVSHSTCLTPLTSSHHAHRHVAAAFELFLTVFEDFAIRLGPKNQPGPTHIDDSDALRFMVKAARGNGPVERRHRALGPQTPSVNTRTDRARRPHRLRACSSSMLRGRCAQRAVGRFHVLCCDSNIVRAFSAGGRQAGGHRSRLRGWASGDSSVSERSV